MCLEAGPTQGGLGYGSSKAPRSVVETLKNCIETISCRTAFGRVQQNRSDSVLLSKVTIMRKALLLLGTFVFFANSAFAAIPVPPSDYIGSRTTPAFSGIGASGGYLEANGGVKIAWNISFDGTFWNYSYTITDKDDSSIAPDLSHWIIEISPHIPFEKIEDYIFDANATVVTPGGSYWGKDPNFPNTTQAGANKGNPNLGTDLVGIKFDSPSPSVGGVYTFKSVEPPVWGDFYLK